MTGGDDPALLLAAARGGSRRALGRLISQAEAGGPAADRLDRLIRTAPGSAWIIGIVGAPGVGKSTLTGRLVTAAAADYPSSAAPRVAVIAVDPSSPFTGGAILGDRVRMVDAAASGVFVRSMAHRGASGGLADAVPVAVRALAAAGIEVILIETVGVGQVELDIATVADTTVVVVSAGWGDAIQASKAGLLEIAEILAVNKSDQPGAEAARRDLEQMLDLGAAIHGGADPAGWRPPVVATTAIDAGGIDDLWAAIGRHRAWSEATGQAARRRRSAVHHEVRRRALARLARRLDALMDADPPTADHTPGEAARLLERRLAAGDAAPGGLV